MKRTLSVLCLVVAGCGTPYESVSVAENRPAANRVVNLNSSRYIIATQEDADKLNEMAKHAEVRIFDEGIGPDCRYLLGKQPNGTTVVLRVDSPYPKLDVSVVRIFPKTGKPGQNCEYHQPEWGWLDACAPTVTIEPQRERGK